jgi:hypothetical protein
MDLATQVSALIGTSFILFLVTTPKYDDCLDEFSDPTKLKGCFKYSPYHRKKLYATMSMASSLPDDSASSVSSDTRSERSTGSL